MTALAAVADVEIDELALLLAGNKLRGLAGKGVQVADRIVDGTISRTMSGASTLTLVIEDDRRDLLRSGLFDRLIDIEIDGLWWRLVQVTKQGDQLTLTFEDRSVALLRKITTPRKASRAKMTRAEFALSIVREVQPPIPFFCPELHVKQPIAAESQQVTSATKVATAGQGIAADAPLTVKGSPATSAQKALAERALDVASSLGASERATLALIEACIVESTFSNPSTPSADGYGSRGILQVRDSTAKGMTPPISNTDVEACCNAFLTRGFTGAGGAIAVAAKNPGWTTGQIAQAVQGSAYPSRYDQVHTEAQAWVASYTGTTASTVTQVEPYQFQRGGTAGVKEDSWTCLQRLASEVAWVCFAADGQIVFASETTLLNQKPAATLTEQTPGVDTIDFDVDTGKTTNDATVVARAARWAFPPGSALVLDGSGPADGRWLADTIDRSLFDASVTVRLKRAVKPLLEPAPSTTSSVAGGTGAAPFASQVSPLVSRAYAAAQVIDAKRYPYVWGGGHAHCGTPDGGIKGGEGGGIGLTGYDCSGSVCAVLAAAGMGFTRGAPAQVSGWLASSWGEPGKGAGLTVYANDVHTFIVFTTAAGDEHWGTGSWGKPWDGPGFNPLMHPLTGFTARHWPGT